MRNKFLLILVATALVVALVGVTACEKEEPLEEWQWPEKLTILSLGIASTPYACDVAYSVLLQEDTGMKVRVVGEDSHVLRYNWMKQQKFFWMTSENRHMIAMLQGEGEYANRDGGPWQMRIGYGAVLPIYVGYAVRGNSDIETPLDIKAGHSIAYPAYAGPAGRAIVESLLAWADVDPDDIVWVPASTPTMCTTALMDGRADIAFGSPGSAHWYEAETGPYGLKWIEMNQENEPEGYARYVESSPITMTGPNDTGVPSSIGVHMLTDLAGKLIHADTDPELVYRIVKWCNENFDLYKDAHPLLPGMGLDWLMKIVERSYLPAHEGTIRYLKELGMWTDAHEARNQANVELVTRWVEAYETAIDMADEQEIHVSSENEKWLELWENYKTTLELPSFALFGGLD